MLKHLGCAVFGLAMASSAYAEGAIQPAPVAVIYDGWRPQGRGVFSPMPCQVALRYGVTAPRIAINGLFSYYPIGSPPSERRSSRVIDGNGLTLTTYPTHLTFSTSAGQRHEEWLFSAGTNPSEDSFWGMVHRIEYTVTEAEAGGSGQPQQTVLFDCQVAKVSWERM